MKDATGELSTTVIAIVAIAAILAVFTAFLLPTLKAQIALTQACNNGPGYSTTSAGGGFVECGTDTTKTTCSSGTIKGTKTCNAGTTGATQYSCVYCE